MKCNKSVDEIALQFSARPTSTALAFQELATARTLMNEK
jgi:hypothetical protein